MDGKERANRFYLARVGFNRHGKETKTRVYEETGVPASAIVDYENPQSTRSLNIKNVQKLADHYGVNAAWLLGQSESWSLDTDIRQISESTGLTPEAIWALQALTKDEGQRSFINHFLASDEFARIVCSLQSTKEISGTTSTDSCIDYTAAITQSDAENELSLNECDIRDMKLWKASRDMESFLKNFFDYQPKEGKESWRP